MILNVFTRIGVRLSVANAYQQLIALNPNDPYAKHKAAGSLGCLLYTSPSPRD